MSKLCRKGEMLDRKALSAGLALGLHMELFIGAVPLGLYNKSATSLSYCQPGEVKLCVTWRSILLCKSCATRWRLVASTDDEFVERLSRVSCLSYTLHRLLNRVTAVRCYETRVKL